jgi:hypothetical protein
MQIIVKQNPDRDNKFGLFDTRSNQFIPGGGVSDPEDTSVLDIANNLARKSPRTIYNIVQNWEYIEGEGYTEAMIAQKYLELNPDIAARAKEMLAEKPVRKSRVKKEKPVQIDEITGEVIEEVVKPKGKVGRPRRVYTTEELEKIAFRKANPRGRGRPKKDKIVKPIVLINGEKRRRGRPRKNPEVITYGQTTTI